MRNNKQALYESVMKSVAKQVKRSLNEVTLVDNKEKYKDSKNYYFYIVMCIYLQFIMDNLTKLSSGNAPFLIKDLQVTGEIPYTHNQIGKSFSIGHIIGLAAEEALVACLRTSVNDFQHEVADDYADIIGDQGFDVSEKINIIMGKDNQPIHDFSVNYLGKTYNVQIKAVNHKNEGVNEMNAAIRNNVDLGIVIVYNMIGNNMLIDSLQVYVPDVDRTFDYISKDKLGSRRLSLNKSRSFLTIGPNMLGNKGYKHRF